MTMSGGMTMSRGLTMSAPAETAHRLGPIDRDAGGSPVTAHRRQMALLPGLDKLLLAAAAVSMVGRVPFTAYSTTLRIALLVLIGVPGLLVLIDRSRHSRPARWLVGLLIAAFVSALGSSNVLYALKLDVAGAPSWSFLALGAGWWAMGTVFTPVGRRLLPAALLAGFGVNGCVAVLQLVFDIRTGPLSTFPGRASGLMDNPVYFATIGAGLTAWALARGAGSGRRIWFGAVTVLSILTGLSGSRVAAMVIVAVGVGVWAIRRTIRSGVLATSALTGLALSSLFVAMTSALTGSSRSSAAPGSYGTVGRLSTGEGPGERLEIWRYGLSALLDRPLFGWGPGHFGFATWPHYTMEFVRDSQWHDDVQPWNDPHNLGVLLLTTTGLVGVTLLAGFLVSGFRRGVDPSLLVLALSAAATWSLQPATVHTWPLVLLVLGAAMSVGNVDPPVAPIGRPWISGALLVGLAVGCSLLVADYRFGAALRDGDPAALEAAASWFPNDPNVARDIASRLEAAGDAGPDRLVGVVEWSVTALDWGPESPMAHNRVALAQYLNGDLVGMRRSIERAIVLQPWNPSARGLMVLHAFAGEDVAARQAAVDDVCVLDLPICGPARILLDDTSV